MNSRYEEIRIQISQLEREAAAIRADEVRIALEEIRSKVQLLGLTPDDIFSHRKPTAIRGKRVMIKYQDANGNAWSGRGKTPRWLLAAIEAGIPREALLVSGNPRSPENRPS